MVAEVSTPSDRRIPEFSESTGAASPSTCQINLTREELKRLSTTLMYTDYAETFKITPEYFQGYFYMIWCFIFFSTGIITAFWGDLDWEDNIIYNELGVNSICVLFDYKPAIYITPFLSCLLVVAATFYIFGYMTRIFLLKQIGMLTETEFKLFKLSFIIEGISTFFLVSVFSINDENVKFHFTAYCQCVLCQVLMGWRNVYYLIHYGHLSELKKKVLYVWTPIFTYMGLHYSIGMLVWVHTRKYALFGSDEMQKAWAMFLDLGFTLMFFVGHCFAGCFVNDTGNSLIVSVVFKEGRVDSPGQILKFHAGEKKFGIKGVQSGPDMQLVQISRKNSGSSERSSDDVVVNQDHLTITEPPE